MKKKATVTTPVNELTREETIEHYNAVMIEEIRSTIRTELEGIHSRMDSFERKMDSLEKRMDSFENRMDSLENRMDSFRIEVNNRFDMLEAAIKCNADGIRELRVDVNHLKNETTGIKDLLIHVIDRVDDHEVRLGRVEQTS